NADLVVREVAGVNAEAPRQTRDGCQDEGVLEADTITSYDNGVDVCRRTPTQSGPVPRHLCISADADLRGTDVERLPAGELNTLPSSIVEHLLESGVSSASPIKRDAEHLWSDLP